MFQPESRDVDTESVMIDYRIGKTLICIDYWVDSDLPRVTVHSLPEEWVFDGSLFRSIGAIAEKMKFTYTQKNEFAKNLIDNIRELIQ